MAFFEDLGKKISQTGQGAVQKAKDAAEILKLNGLVSDEEKRINAIYTEIGKKYFELHADDCEAVLVGMINSIKASKDKIDEYSEQIKQLKGITKCPNCRADVQNGSPFCSFCGIKLGITAPSKPNITLCAKCSSEISADSAFCTNCGTKVNNNPPTVTAAPIEPTPAPVQPTPSAVPPVQPTEPSNPISDAQSTPANTEPAAYAQPQAKFCTNCGNKIEGDAVFCTNCGTKL